MSNRLSQLPVEVLVLSDASVPARLSQLPIEALVLSDVPVPARLSQLPIEVLRSSTPEAGAVTGAFLGLTAVLFPGTLTLSAVAVAGAALSSTAVVFSGTVVLPASSPLTITQLAAELLRLVPNSPLAATQVAAEILFANANDLRVEQLACELLIIPRRVSFTCPVDFPIDPL